MINLLARLKEGFLWKIRRRLVVAYTFTGAIPIVLIAGIFYISAVLVYYQFSYFLIFKQIGIHSTRVQTFALSLREGLQQQALDNPRVTPEELRKTVDTEARYILSTYPNASIILNCVDPATGQSVAYLSRHSTSIRLPRYRTPDWLAGGDFSGLVMNDNNGTARNLTLRSLVTGIFPTGGSFSLEVTVPFDSYIMGLLKAALGQELLLAQNDDDYSGVNVILPLTNIDRAHVRAATFDIGGAPAVTRWMWPIPFFPTAWSSGQEMASSQGDMLMVEVSLPQLVRDLYNSESSAGQWIFRALTIIVVIFLLAELASIIFGVMLTRSITKAIHNLDQGTQFVRRGDFSHRIVVRAHDQLGALADSFNQMTEYVQQLVKERVQKERLEREIEIAREVQERLFPDSAPRLPHLAIAGICLPARMVSGDYYDFLTLSADELGLTVGDISGKGISAALLMASLQATLHSNVSCSAADDSPMGGSQNVAELVARVNRQICDYTGGNRFATFFYAHYDDNTRTLSYCNAGHNPPLLFRGADCIRLSGGGTVIGIFPEAEYEQESLQLLEGDLLIAYTDGLSECVNAEGEEFGEERLIQLVQANQNMAIELLKERILETLVAWKAEGEQADDITLIVARLE